MGWSTDEYLLLIGSHSHQAAGKGETDLTSQLVIEERTRNIAVATFGKHNKPQYSLAIFPPDY